MIRMVAGVAWWSLRQRSYDAVNVAAVSAVAVMGSALIACLIELGERS